VVLIFDEVTVVFFPRFRGLTRTVKYGEVRLGRGAVQEASATASTIEPRLSVK
jgi:hypothetical protein